ncbi:hypothetical protein J6590_001942 [Homalodisca vitripennis]|nr:hypothetical protein J6590_001942 [Homalodisca vitripennis]
MIKIKSVLTQRGDRVFDEDSGIPAARGVLLSENMILYARPAVTVGRALFENWSHPCIKQTEKAISHKRAPYGAAHRVVLRRLKLKGDAKTGKNYLDERAEMEGPKREVWITQLLREGRDDYHSLQRSISFLPRPQISCLAVYVFVISISSDTLKGFTWQFPSPTMILLATPSPVGALLGIPVSGR